MAIFHCYVSSPEYIPPEKTAGQEATFDLGKPAGRSYALRKMWCRHWRHPLTFIIIHHHSHHPHHPQYHHHPHHHIPNYPHHNNHNISHVSWFNLHLPHSFPHEKTIRCPVARATMGHGVVALLRFLPEVQHDLGAALLTKEVLLWSLHDFVGMSCWAPSWWGLHLFSYVFMLYIETYGYNINYKVDGFLFSVYMPQYGCCIDS